MTAAQIAEMRSAPAMHGLILLSELFEYRKYDPDDVCTGMHWYRGNYIPGPKYRFILRSWYPVPGTRVPILSFVPLMLLPRSALLLSTARSDASEYHKSIDKRFSPLSFHSAFPPSLTPTVVSACRHPTRRTSKRPLTSSYPAKLPLTIQIKSNFRESQSYAKAFPFWAVYAWAAIVILVNIPSYHHLCIKTLEFPWWFVATFKLASIVSLKLHRLARTFGLGMDARSASDVWLKTIAGWHRGRK